MIQQNPDQTAGALKLKVVEAYTDYQPPFDVKTTVIRMLESLPPEYLFGLSSVVLTNKDALSRKRFTSKTVKSRGRKAYVANAAGLYHQTRSQQAWIELFVDSIFRGRKGWHLRMRSVREGILGEVLFHEVGHHIHYTKRPEFREREDVADDWSDKLQRIYWRKKLFWWARIVRPFRFFIKPLIAWLLPRLEAKYGRPGRKRN